MGRGGGRRREVKEERRRGCFVSDFWSKAKRERVLRLGFLVQGKAGEGASSRIFGPRQSGVGTLSDLHPTWLDESA